MSRENEDREASEITKMKKELERVRKVSNDLLYEITHLQFLEECVTRAGFSQTHPEAANLISDSRKKITCLSEQLFRKEHPVNEPILGDDDDIPKASDVAPEGGNMEPSGDVDDEMKKTYKGGESSKSGGVKDDAA